MLKYWQSFNPKDKTYAELTDAFDLFVDYIKQNNDANKDINENRKIARKIIYHKTLEEHQMEYWFPISVEEHQDLINEQMDEIFAQ